MHHRFVFKPSTSLLVAGFIDADQSFGLDDMKSTSSISMFLEANPMLWSYQKQYMVAQYRALAYATNEVLWLKCLLCEMKTCPPTVPILWCDYLSIIALATNPVFILAPSMWSSIYIFCKKKFLHKSYWHSTFLQRNKLVIV